ncbi:MAG: hypothetical protein KDD41_12695 [Flavobacteriales bacterium]|nr:hypothetical protein [Flavobacteriales bacterium]
MSEKRFFKIFSQRHTIGNENNYVKLFDYIDQTDNTSNQDLIEQPFVKNVAAEKNYLYHLILKSLNIYYYDFSYKMKVQNFITNAEILAYKGLENQALKILKKAEQMATGTELYQHLITIHQLQFEINSKLLDYGAALTSLKTLQASTQQHMHLTEFEFIATAVYQKRTEKGGIRNDEEADAIQQLASHINSNPDSNKKALFYNSLLVANLNSKRDYRKQLSPLLTIISLYESNDYLIQSSPKGYVSSIYNLANTYRHLEDYKLALHTLDKLQEMEENRIIRSSVSLSAYLFYLNNNLRLFIHIHNQQFEEAYQIVQNIEKNYSHFEPHAPKQVYYEHLVLVIRILFHFKAYNKAIRYSNIIINDSTFKVRMDIVTYIRLFNLIIHYEKNNLFSIDYFSQSTKNYLKRKNRLFKTENLIIKFLTGSDSGNKKQLTNIHKDLIKLKKDSYESSMFRLFDFEAWVNEKITRE